jgi:hypothetical protein
MFPRNKNLGFPNTEVKSENDFPTTLSTTKNGYSPDSLQISAVPV